MCLQDFGQEWLMIDASVAFFLIINQCCDTHGSTCATKSGCCFFLKYLPHLSDFFSGPKGAEVHAYGGPFVCKFFLSLLKQFFVHICFITVHSFFCVKLKKVQYQVSGSAKTLNDDQALTASKVHPSIFDIERTNRFFFMKICVFCFVFTFFSLTQGFVVKSRKLSVCCFLLRKGAKGSSCVAKGALTTAKKAKTPAPDYSQIIQLDYYRLY